jgi:uncharacterized protein (DUF1810 family)
VDAPAFGGHVTLGARPVPDEHYDLQRFVDAQRPVYDDVVSELGAGRKQSHWMWFIFPQLRGLGRSRLATTFGVDGLDEARAYLAHPVLGPRLRECTALVKQIAGRSIEEIFGDVDAMKFRSSMTLFARATEDNRVFLDALERYFEGKADRVTLERLDPSS